MAAEAVPSFCSPDRKFSNLPQTPSSATLAKMLKGYSTLIFDHLVLN